MPCIFASMHRLLLENLTPEETGTWWRMKYLQFEICARARMGAALTRRTAATQRARLALVAVLTVLLPAAVVLVSGALAYGRRVA